MDCLDETTVALFVERRLTGAEAGDVERHIDRCADCRRLVGEVGRLRVHDPTAGGVAGAATAPGELDPTELPIGERVGRYVVVGALGRGAMGAVYAAFDPDLDRKLAVKLLRRGAAATTEARARLMREAQALAKISHPSVIAVHDVGTHAGQTFIAMELVVGGGTLRTWVGERPRAWREIVRVMTQAGRGLAAAHATGLVHRDVKPDNILVDADGRARIGDFGLAQALDTPEAVSESGDRSSDPVIRAAAHSVLAESLTETGAVVGTPAYMAPEQIGGAVVTARSDQFSFCATLYEALYGVRPYLGPTLAAIMEAMRAGRIPDPPAERDRAVPRWLRAAVVRGLAIDPARRHPSMDALLTALTRDPVRRRMWWLIGGGTGVVATTGVVLAVALTRAGDPCAGADAPPAGGYTPADAAAIRAGFATSPLGFAAAAADHAIAGLDGWRTRAGGLRQAACKAARVDRTESAELFDLRMRCLTDSARRVAALVRALAQPTPALVEGAVAAVNEAADLELCTLPRALLQPFAAPAEPAARKQDDALRARLDAARASYDAGVYADAIAAGTEIAGAAHAAGLAAVEALAWQLVGDAHSSTEDRRGSRDAWQKALIASEAAGYETLRTKLYLTLARVEQDLDRTDDAERWVAQARAVVDRIDDPGLQFDVAYTEALVPSWRGDLAGALPLLRAVVDARTRAVAGADDDNLASALAALGSVQFQSEDIAGGELLLRRALAMRERMYGPAHPKLIDVLDVLGAIELSTGRAEDALTTLRRAHAIAEQAAGPDGARMEHSVMLIATALAQLGRGEEAIPMIDQALVTFGRTFGADTTHVATIRSMRADILTGLGRVDEALPDQEAAVAIARAHYPPDSPDIASSLSGLARTLQAAHRIPEAIAAYDEALAILAKTPSTDAFYPEQGLAMVYLDQGQLAKAGPHFERALTFRPAGAGFDPSERAFVQFNLARVRREHDRDRAAAIVLLRDARAGYAASDGHADAVAEIDASLEQLGAKP